MKSATPKLQLKPPIVARVNVKTIYTVRHVYLTTMTVLLMLQTAFYSNHVSASRPIATSKKTPCHFVTQSIKIISHVVHFQSEKQKLVCILSPEV